MYVDILVMGSDKTHVSNFITRMASVFKVRDMGAPSFFLGIETVPHREGLLLSQK